MVYVIAVYDVQADRTRLFLNYLRRHLVHVQNSVFEGEVTEGELERMRNHVEDLLEPGESTIIYTVSAESYVDRTVFGDDPTEDSQFL
ncbi:CRISPR-associated endonuclease Cas2 [Halococcus agarilyticus]|uniref:CRISPR-associated endonuclease Cas2 n=1 Tax=Halococcus agarilyticus TaxID=1232219 RepID=UPI000677A1ED|nr:CRISPR-associated endonuclease Cas2 [Halococcus agarilyticus]